MAAYEVLLAAAIDAFEMAGYTPEELGSVLARATRPAAMTLGNPKVQADTDSARRLLRSYPATERLLAAEM